MRSNPLCFHSETVGDYIIDLHYDEFPMDPRTDWDPFGTMLCAHPRYKLGEKQVDDVDRYDSWRDVLQRVAIEAYGAVVYLPLFLIDHSGIAMRTHSFSDIDPGQWDSGQVGWIFCTEDDIRENFGIQEITDEYLQRAKELLIAEVNVYSAFLEGRVCGYVIKRFDGEFIDSCWSFFDPDDALAEARGQISHLPQNDRREVLTLSEVSRDELKVVYTVNTGDERLLKIEVDDGTVKIYDPDDNGRDAWGRRKPLHEEDPIEKRQADHERFLASEGADELFEGRGE